MPLYFAYGSNMGRTAMRRRCPGARAIGTGTLEGWRFLITADGYASIARRRGARVHGVLWRLSPRDLAALHRYEGVDTGLYRRQVLPVRAGGRLTSALVYIGRSTAPGRPRPGYLAQVIAAARRWALPAAYLDAMQRGAGPTLLAARVPESGETG